MFKRSALALVLLVMVGAFFACNKEGISKPHFIFKANTNKSVVAKAIGKDLTFDELFKDIKADIYEAEMKVFELKMNRLKAYLMEKFMESDPRKKGLTNDQYLEKYVLKGKLPGDRDIKKFIKEKNIPKEHINDQMKERVRQFLTMEFKKTAVEKWLAQKTKKSPVEVYLSKPQRPTYDVNVGDAPYYGKADSKVTLVEYTDFQCPFCSKAHKTMQDLKKKYGNKLKVVLMHYPLPFHTNGKAAANASFCAGEQKDKYLWKMNDLMFQNQDKLDKNGLIELASKAGLRKDDFEKCLTDNKYMAKVDADMAQGKKLGLSSVPAFFVNGKLINGAHPKETFIELIEEEFARK